MSLEYLKESTLDLDRCVGNSIRFCWVQKQTIRQWKSILCVRFLDKYIQCFKQFFVRTESIFYFLVISYPQYIQNGPQFQNAIYRFFLYEGFPVCGYLLVCNTESNRRRGTCVFALKRLYALSHTKIAPKFYDI